MADASKMAACVGSRSFAFFLLAVAVIHFVPRDVEGGLTTSKVCGEIPCKEYEFCSEYDGRCAKCESVCEKDSHNYQEDVCHKDCQDYLQDQLHKDLRNDVERLKALTAASLAVSLILLLILSAFIFWMWRRLRRSFVSDGGESANRNQDDRYEISHTNGKVASKKNPSKSDKNAEAAVSNTGNALKLDIAAATPGVSQQQTNSRQTPQPQAPLPHERTGISTPGTAGGRSVSTDTYPSPTTTSTPLSNRLPRYPVEDTTLGYAYDNRALTPSPGLENGNGSSHHPSTPYHRPQQLGIKGETTF